MDIVEQKRVLVVVPVVVVVAIMVDFYRPVLLSEKRKQTKNIQTVDTGIEQTKELDMNTKQNRKCWTAYPSIHGLL